MRHEEPTGTTRGDTTAAALEQAVIAPPTEVAPTATSDGSEHPPGLALAGKPAERRTKEKGRR